MRRVNRLIPLLVAAALAGTVTPAAVAVLINVVFTDVRDARDSGSALAVSAAHDTEHAVGPAEVFDWNVTMNDPAEPAEYQIPQFDADTMSYACSYDVPDCSQCDRMSSLSTISCLVE